MHVVRAVAIPEGAVNRSWNGSSGAATARPEIRLCCSSPSIDAYDLAGAILWVAGGSILFAWPASLLLAAVHRKHLGA